MAFLFILVLSTASKGQEESGIKHGMYYFNKEIRGDFDRVVERIIYVFKEEQFGVVTELNMGLTINEKLGTDMNRYKVIGMCNPGYAHKAIMVEPNIGLMLPCKVLIREVDQNTCSVSAMDPISMMKSINNPALDEIANKVSGHFKRALERL